MQPAQTSLYEVRDKLLRSVEGKWRGSPQRVLPPAFLEGRFSWFDAGAPAREQDHVIHINWSPDEQCRNLCSFRVAPRGRPDVRNRIRTSETRHCNRHLCSFRVRPDICLLAEFVPARFWRGTLCRSASFIASSFRRLLRCEPRRCRRRYRSWRSRQPTPVECGRGELAPREGSNSDSNALPNAARGL